MAPAEFLESTEIAVGRDPFAARLDGHRRKICIRYEISPRVAFAAEALEERPVTGTRRDMHAVRLRAHLLGEGQGIDQAAGTLENFRVGDDPNESAQHQFRDAISFVAVDNLFEPFTICGMVNRVLPMCVDEHIDIRENQLRTPSLRAMPPSR